MDLVNKYKKVEIRIFAKQLLEILWQGTESIIETEDEDTTDDEWADGFKEFSQEVFDVLHEGE